MSLSPIKSPLTSIGVRVGKPLELSTPQFLIHESGFLPHGADDWNKDSIVSPFWCLWHVIDEGNWIESGGKRWDLGPEHIVFAPAQVVYRPHNYHPAPQLWVHFSLVPDYAFQASAVFAIPRDNLLQELVIGLIDAHGSIREDSSRLIYHHATALLNVCFARSPVPLRMVPDTLHTVLQEIESAPESDWSNTRLARSVNLSTSGFIYWFEKHMNQSPAAYVRSIRCNKASQLLLFSDMSIEQIAEELRFPNRHYFSRAFAKHAGCGPATFRKNHRSPRNI
jgi:AraC family transcriptional regulator of arabinose operon